MKTNLKFIHFLFAVVFLTFSLISFATEKVKKSVIAIYPAVTGMPLNSDFNVRVREKGGRAWQNLYNYNVTVNNYNPQYASMVNFSFSGTIDMEVTYNYGKIREYEIRPAHMVSNIIQKENVITFNTTQVDTFPRKFVVIVNGDLDHCLHVLGNPLEVNPPKETDANVCVVEPGQTTIPLPPGKDTYYFKPGLHAGEHLGAWLELDLGQSYDVDKITLVQREYATRFKVYVRNDLYEYYTLAYDGSNNNSGGTISQTFAPVNCRFVKIQFFENRSDPFYLTHINEFMVFAGTSENLALNKFRVGSNAEMKAIVNGNEKDGWQPARYLGETSREEGVAGRFWLYADGQKIYIPGGAVLRGGIWATGLSNITVSGRGIIDGSKSFRTSPIEFPGRLIPYLNFEGETGDTLEGITVIDPPALTTFMICSNSLIKNYNSIGYAVNSDGFNLGGDSFNNSGAENVTLTGVFVRTSDDILAYPHLNVTCKNSVVWGDRAQVFFIISGNNIRYSNIDVIGHQERIPEYRGVIAVKACMNGSISNVTFEDIRISPFRDPKNAMVMWISTANTTNWFPVQGQSIRNIVLRNITYEGTDEVPSIIEGASASQTVDGVHIINYSRKGIPCVDTPEAGNIIIKSFVHNVTFDCDQGHSQGQHIKK